MLSGAASAILMTIRSAFRCWHFIFIYLYTTRPHTDCLHCHGAGQRAGQREGERAYQDVRSPVLIDRAGTPHQAAGPACRPLAAGFDIRVLIICRATSGAT